MREDGEGRTPPPPPTLLILYPLYCSTPPHPLVTRVTCSAHTLNKRAPRGTGGRRATTAQALLATCPPPPGHAHLRLSATRRSPLSLSCMTLSLPSPPTNVGAFPSHSRSLSAPPSLELRSRVIDWRLVKAKSNATAYSSTTNTILTSKATTAGILLLSVGLPPPFRGIKASHGHTRPWWPTEHTSGRRSLSTPLPCGLLGL